MPPWLIVLALGMVLVVAIGFTIRVNADFVFSFSSRPAFCLRLYSWFFRWEKQWFKGDGGSTGNLAAAAGAKGNGGAMASKETESWSGAYPESPREAGFIRLPSWRAWHANVKSRAQRALFRLATEPRFWLSLVRLGGSLPRIFWQGLHIEILELRLSLANPSSLGRWVGLSHALASALGRPIPLGCDFTQRSVSLSGQLQAGMNVWGALGLGLRMVLAIPWFLAVQALGKAFFTRGFSGWRGSALRLLLKWMRQGRSAAK